MRSRLATATVVLGLAAGAAGLTAGPAAAARSCSSIQNPYAGTRYSGVPLSHIKAAGASCTTARKVVRGAHRKGLGLTPPTSGVRRYTWNGWKVTGDLRPESDRYTARRGGKVVRWRF